MFLASLILSGRDWLLPVAVLTVVALLLLWWAYRRAPAMGAVRAACAGLKVLGGIFAVGDVHGDIIDCRCVGRRDSGREKQSGSEVKS